jgi:hypothetical protein
VEKVGNYLKEDLAKPGYKSKHESTNLLNHKYIYIFNYILKTKYRNVVILFYFLFLTHG